MFLSMWILLGLIVGLIAAVMQRELTVQRLILSLVIGAIGALMGGVMAYLFYGVTMGRFDLTIFSFALLFVFCAIHYRKQLGTVQQTIEEFLLKGIPVKESAEIPTKQVVEGSV